ncbi:amidase [Arthrobacter sp. NicSoilB8]|uniref:amidase n=1 Tax=Arthrobacter sp. NicSoilB8 TaxID=2830998 RepID=UPI001CC58B93|nr:amidase [Arthrobacter sp. NicSoilB8]BCW73485.1 amidase [Arthrobacter sp. NicSoilB8]
MTTTDYTHSTATELISAMNDRAVSAVELASAAMDRIERYDSGINAIPVRDFDRALDAARVADAARARGAGGPLLGVPITVKESFNVAGLPTTWGIPPFKNFVPTEDAVAVARLKAAGAVILGKTNVPVALGDLQTYNPIYGTTNNPWDRERTPGGSSGGSAAALAAGFGAVSIGSDIAGSLRMPAHFTGVYAHKPSFGLLPARGHTTPPARPLAYDRDLTVIGPMARSASDLALMLNLLAEPDATGVGIAHRLALPPARHDDLPSYRVLIVDTHPLIPTSTDVRTAIDYLASGLAQAGAKVNRNSVLLPDQIEAARLYMRLLLASIAAAYPPDVYEQARTASQRVDPDDISLAAERTRGAALSYRDWITADSLRTRHRAAWSELFTEFDIVICPAAPTTAFRHDQSADLWARTIPIDDADYDYADQLVWAGVATTPGLPATAVPITRSPDGLPIGVQLIGPMFEDHTPIRFAQLLEQEFGGFTPPASR